MMKKSCLYFDKKYKCVSFIVHYKGLTLTLEWPNKQFVKLWNIIKFKYILPKNVNTC